MPFCHLHVHSHFSFLQGTMGPKALMEEVVKAGMDTVAMTDSSNVCALVEAFEAAEKLRCATCGKEVKEADGKKVCGGGHEDPPTTKVKLVVGAELWTVDGEGSDERPAPGVQLVVLVEDLDGWKNLCSLLTLAHRQRSFCPRIRTAQLREHRSGLRFLTGGRWGVFWQEDRAEERLRTLVEAVGSDQVEVEVVDHGFDEDGPRNRLAIRLAKELRLPILATNDVRYAGAEDCAILEALTEIGTSDHDLTLSVTATDQAFLKTASEMAELWPTEWLERTAVVAGKCSFVVPRGKPMLPRVEADEGLASIMERFPPPKGFPEPPDPLDGEGRPVDRWFRWLCRTGLELRLQEEPWATDFGTAEDYRTQLEFECGVIERMDYVVYHLIVSEFTNWAKDNDVAVGPGRGSAAGSVAVWALRITDVNPRQFGLFFERFLNPERRGLPDIDMDFEQQGRGRVIAHVRDRYGEACVGQMLTIGKMKAKASLKDSARVCGVGFDESNYWSMFVDDGPKAKLKDSVAHGYLASLREGSPLFRRVADLALSLEGKPRQQGVHAAGVIIASDPISKFCPMHYVPEDDLSCTGVDMDAAEKLGLVKFDFLGLKTLDVIKLCCETVAERTGEIPTTVDPYFDDPAVFELLRKGDTAGVFQIESPGMSGLTRRLLPDTFEDIVCMLALYRPGPLRAGMVDSWVERKHGREPMGSIHPLLDTVMAPTYGLMVYQEQALSTARILAGFSLGEADLLRRAIGKKKPEEMAAQKEAFVSGCHKTNGIDRKEAERVFSLIDYFSGYSFNKAHSAAYAVVSYQTAKLKIHHRTDFMAAAMTLDMGRADKIRKYAANLRRATVPVLRPDVNRSAIGFVAEDDGVRFGLGAVNGVGDSVLGTIIANRPYSSVEDLLAKTKISKSVVGKLVWAGALDSVEPDRFDAWWKLERPKPKALPKKVAADQVLMFGGGKTVGDLKKEEESAAEALVKPPRPTEAELVDREVEALGVSLGVHPLRRYDDVAPRVRTHTLEGIRSVGQEKTPFVTTARIDVVEKEEDRRGEAIAFVTVEDGDSSLQFVLRGQAYRATDKEILVVGACVAIHGTASAFEQDDPVVMVERVESLAEFRWRTGKTVVLTVHPSDRPFLGQIRTLLDGRVDGGTHQVLVRMVENGTETFGRLDRKICPDDRLRDALERMTGRPDVLGMKKSSDDSTDDPISATISDNDRA